MRSGLVLLLGLVGVAGVGAADATTDRTGMRFGIAVDLKTYPQATPQETLTSILKAIDLNRLDYLAAQLAEPTFIDYRVSTFGSRFQDQVEDLAARLDPSTVKLLQRFRKEGEWNVAGKETMVLLKDKKDRFLFFQKIGDRWYLLHRSRPEKVVPKPDKPEGKQEQPDK